MIRLIMGNDDHKNPLVQVSKLESYICELIQLEFHRKTVSDRPVKSKNTVGSSFKLESNILNQNPLENHRKTVSGRPVKSKKPVTAPFYKWCRWMEFSPPAA